MIEFNPETGLLLGTAGWDSAPLLERYYPADLPQDWRLAYYANDCECVLLPAAAWIGTDIAGLKEQLGEAPPGLVFFLQTGAVEASRIVAGLRLFEGRPTVLLCDRAPIPGIDLPQWRRDTDDPEGLWIDTASAARLARWRIEGFDLRDLRARAESLDSRVTALILDGPAAFADRIHELRTLFALLGRGQRPAC